MTPRGLLTFGKIKVHLNLKMEMSIISTGTNPMNLLQNVEKGHTKASCGYVLRIHMYLWMYQPNSDHSSSET